MRNLKIHIVFIAILVLFGSCYKEVEVFNSEPDNLLELPFVLKLDNKECGFDYQQKLLRFPISNDTISEFSVLVEFKENAILKFNGKELKNGVENSLGEIIIGECYNIDLEIDNVINNFDLVFTNLPIVKVICDSEIYDEPKSLGRIKIINPLGSEVFSSFMGIEIRGKHSRSYPKKSMGFELWKNMVDNEVLSEQLLGLTENSNWILNGAVVDPSRIRNLVSFEIWNQLPNSEHVGISSKPVELFYNHSFRGIYIFSEIINAEFLKTSFQSVLYKGIDWSNGATCFENYNSELSSNQFWNGWEQKIPDRKENINWEPLSELYDLVVNGDDYLFSETIEQFIEIDNFMDYYLFLNLVNAQDNTGKNIFLYKESESSKFKIIPWDLDGSWGIRFDGMRMNHNGILSNNLFERLIKTNPDNFREKMRERWFFLRANNFNEQNIMLTFDSCFSLMNSSDIIQKESEIWDLQLNMKIEKEYINDWALKRLQYLDNYFQNL